MDKIKKLDEMYGRYLDISGITNKRLDIAYGHASERNKLDIYYPEDYDPDKRYPAILFFHGGAFIKGDKQRYQLLGALQGIYRGYAVVSANYRFITTDPFPSCVEDAYGVSRFLKERGGLYHLDTDQMAVWGESAGAVLALAVGFSQEDSAADAKIRFKAIVDWYGSDPRRRGIGMEIHPDSPALLIQHGTLDEFVPLTDSLQIKEEYEKQGNPQKVEMDVLDGFHHGVGEFCTDQNIDRIFGFLDKHVKNKR